MLDKYAATWVSHSSISDYIRCPRAYFLNNVYKDPKTGHKISLMSPALALGQIVHLVLDDISSLPVEERLEIPLTDRFEKRWEDIKGIKGGFKDVRTEDEYKERGEAMLKYVMDSPGPLLNKAVRIAQDLPNYYISEEDEIILCGQIDWLEYLPDDSVHIIDFKTGKNEEDGTSLQLPIYLLLVTHTQKRVVSKASYWYLEQKKALTEVPLPDIEKAEQGVLKIAKTIKLARKLGVFECPKNGCFSCEKLELIVAGRGTFVGVNDFKQDVYILE